jgi:hypothetical protein
VFCLEKVRRGLAAAGTVLVAGLFSYAQQPPPQMTPYELVRRAAANEVKATNSNQFFLYKDRTVYRSRSVTREVLETPQGNLGRTIAFNGRPLGPDERTKDDQKLEKFAHDPEARRRRLQSNKEEDRRAQTMLTSLPDAFLYTYAGTQKGPNGDELVHLTFKPNPNFDPPNHETAVYGGMQGDLLIDAKAMRIAKIDGTLFKDVDFGWGILGRLYRGGKFIIEQRDVGGGRWEMVRETLQFNGRILLFKTLTIDSTETMADFRPVPSNISVAQALELLRKSDETMAENQGGGGGESKDRK